MVFNKKQKIIKRFLKTCIRLAIVTLTKDPRVELLKIFKEDIGKKK